MGSGVSVSRAGSRASVASKSGLPSRRQSEASSKSPDNEPPKQSTGPSQTKETKIPPKTVDECDASKESKIKKDESEKEKPTKKNVPTVSSGTTSGTNGCEVMISYSHNDSDFMKKVKAGLEDAGISVWVDITGLKAGVDFLSKIGQAIINCKMFAQLLSESSITSKYCQDELALAYVSNKPIFPVSMQAPEVLFPKMDTGVKLQLARFTWNLFTDPGDFDQDMATLVAKLNEFKDSGKVESTLERSKSRILRGNSRQNVNKHLKKKTSFDKKVEWMSVALAQTDEVDFWEHSFKKKESVTWKTFVETFSVQYKSSLQAMFSKSDQEWLQRIIRIELLNDEEDNIVTHESYLDFCTVDGELMSFWQRVQDQAVESYTMKEVFDMNSSVRVEAIENLGKFRSKAVVEALVDLLRDKDNNIRAVAAISLARTGEDSPKIIRELVRCLNDSDRLVREGACLALGHLKSQQAVTKILHLWRNDFISSVREAAQVALEQIGGTEANKAMYITKVLSEEIRTLTKE